MSNAKWQSVDEALRRELVKALNSKKFPVLIYGPPGSGKSCALACLYVSYRSTGVEPRWLQLEEFVQQVVSCRTSPDRKVSVPSVIRSTSGGGFGNAESIRRSEPEWFGMICRAPLLFIDDCGLRQASDAAREIAHKLFSQRSSLEPTFISTNLPPEKLKECYDGRIVSRMCQGTVIHLNAPDQRLSETNFIELY